MKKYNNINEEIERIKSLFTEERLYGNLINEKKIIKEQFIQILKKLLGSTKKLKFNSKLIRKNNVSFDDVFGRVKNKDELTDDILKDLGIVLKDSDIPKEQIDFLIKYSKKVKEGNVIDIFKKTGDRHLFELFPDDITDDLILDYFNTLTDTTLKKENIQKFKSYLVENGIRNDELPKKLQNLLKNIPSVKIEKSLVKIEKSLDDGGSVMIEIDISTPEGKQFLKELGITNPNPYIINKSTDKVVEDIMSIGVSSTNKLTFLKNLRKYYPKRIIKAIATVADHTIPLVGFRNAFRKNWDYVNKKEKIKTTIWSSSIFAIATYPVIYDTFTGGEGYWFTGFLKLNKTDTAKKIGEEVDNYLDNDFCNSLKVASNNNMNCLSLGDKVKKLIQDIISITPENKEEICAELTQDKSYNDLFKEKMIDNKEKIASVLKDEIMPEDDGKLKTLLEDNLFSNDEEIVNVIMSLINTNTEFKESIEHIYTDLQIQCNKDKEFEVEEVEYETFDMSDFNKK